MTPSERLNAILLIGLTIAFTGGFIVGSRRSDPPQSPYPANYDPARADLAASLRACQETLSVTARAAQGVSH
jgi:hypothetical protein